MTFQEITNLISLEEAVDNDTEQETARKIPHSSVHNNDPDYDRSSQMKRGTNSTLSCYQK